MKKIKVLAFCDSPAVSTGFGHVSKNILNSIHATGRYDIRVWGINQLGWYDQTQYPYRIDQPMINPFNDVYGFDELKKLILSGEYQIFFGFNDLHILNVLNDTIKKAKEKNNLTYILYSPVDTNVLFSSSLECIRICDFPVLYTEFAKEVIRRADKNLPNRCKVIYHGCDPSFKRHSDEERRRLRKKYFQVDDSTFIIINVNRNQWRKDLGRTSMFFREFKKVVPNSKLYLHSKMMDKGGHLPTQAVSCGLDLEKDIVFCSKKFDERTGVPRETLNELYSCSDLLVSTTLGEGWGLSVTEAFSVKLPVLVPCNTSLVEIVGPNEERGFMCKCGTNVNEWIFSYGNSDIMRPIVNIQSMVEKAKYIYDNIGNDNVISRVNNAYEWANKNSWENICKQWVRVFDIASLS